MWIRVSKPNNSRSPIIQTQPSSSPLFSLFSTLYNPTLPNLLVMFLDILWILTGNLNNTILFFLSFNFKYLSISPIIQRVTVVINCYNKLNSLISFHYIVQRIFQKWFLEFTLGWLGKDPTGSWNPTFFLVAETVLKFNFSHFDTCWWGLNPDNLDPSSLFVPPYGLLS